MRTLRKLLVESAQAMVRLVAPPRCAACDAPVPAPAVFCASCEPEGVVRTRVDRLECGRVVISTGLYDGPLRAAVRALKYRNRPDLGHLLGVRLASAIRESALPDALLVPVPLHAGRLAERGYNQSALVAEAAARALGFPSGLRVLVRTRRTGEQATLDRPGRLTNVAAAFAVRAPVDGRPRAIIVDDVVTTGATTLSCAAALERAGAVVVAIAAVARADRVELR